MLVPGKCCGWVSGRASFAFLEVHAPRVRAPKVHAFDETVCDGINVPHLAIRKNLATETLHELVNPDLSLAPFAVDRFDRLHMRIELLPLPTPVGANRLFPNHTTAFRCPGPTDVVNHERKDAVNVSLVKSRVGLSDQRPCIPHESSSVPMRTLHKKRRESPRRLVNTGDYFAWPVGALFSRSQFALTPSAEPIGSAMPAPRTDPRNTVSRARPYRCGTP